MVKKRFKKLFAVLTLAAVIISNSGIVHAATISDTYMKGISVGFTSMGNISTLDFTLTGDYFINGQGIILSGNNSYRIMLTNSTLNLYQNGVLLYSSSSDISIKPLVSGTFIKFSKDGYLRQFTGTMTFKNNGTSLIPINLLKMEDYLKGVVPYEESNSWPIEALKAQAIAARTYAIKNAGKYVNQGFDLSDDTNSQVYEGYSSSLSNSNQAVDSTKGTVLTYNGNAIDALYSSSNGGYTEVPQAIGWNPLSYIPDPKADTFDTHNVVTLTPADILKLIQNNYPSLNAKQFIRMDISNVVGKPNVNTLNITYNDGVDPNINGNIILDINNPNAYPKDFFHILSNWFTIVQSNGNYVFNVRYGHGIGMSQWGAYARANNGQTFDSILNFYYLNTSLNNAFVSGKIINTVNRIGGQDRFSTSVKIAENMYSGQINNVVLSTGYNFPDALSGSVLAKSLGSPILLVGASPDSSDSSQALNYINNHLNKTGKIYLLGGDAVISPSFVTKLTQMGYSSANIIRLSGANRLQTSMKIASELNAAPSTNIVIATANDFPDALSISPIAALRGWPILLTDKDSLSSDLESYILSVKPDKVYITGGTGVVSDTVKNRIKTLLNYGDDRVIRVGGSDRYATSRIINSTLAQDPSEVALATGLQYPDALSGSVYAALKGGTIMLTDSNSQIEAQNYIKAVGSNANSINVTVLGLQGAVSDNTITTLTNLTN